jgi:Ca2+-binding EF-hand superfamily protein
MRLLSLLTFGVIMLFAAGSARSQTSQSTDDQSQQRRHGRQEMYQRLDTNRDGKISREEWRGRAEGFAKLDTNADGFLTPEEMQAGRFQRDGSARRGPRMMDQNHDRQVSRDEWKGPAEVFDRLDTNHDGSLTREEFAAGRQHDRGGRRGLRSMDQNNDSQISREEWKGPAELFNRLDSNNDGVITSDEIKAHRGKGRAGIK